MIRLNCLCVGLLLILAGCRTQPYVNAHIESVNAEYRELEDYVYCLEEENARLVQEMDSIRQRGTSGGEKSGSGGGLFRRGRKGTPDSGSPSGGPGSTTDPPMIELPGASSPTTPRSRSTLQRPELDAPAETPPSLEPPRIELPGPMGALPTTHADTQLAAAEEPLSLAAAATTKPAPSDNKVTHIALNTLLTGGADFDGQPGDEGLCVVLEPRNAADQYLPQAGAISVVVLDPTRQGDAARIARWDFDSSAVEQLLHRAQAARGIKLELPWPAAPPAASNLKLFVRYETPDGRKLQTDRDIPLTPAGQTASRWTPRPPERQRPLAAAPSTPTLPAAEPKPLPAESVASATALQPSSPPTSLGVEREAKKSVRPAWSPNR